MQAELVRVDKVSKALNSNERRENKNKKEKLRDKGNKQRDEGKSAQTFHRKNLLSSHTLKHLSSKLLMEDDKNEEEKILLANKIYSKMKNWNKNKLNNSGKIENKNNNNLEAENEDSETE